MAHKPILSIIGCGKTGKTLAYLFNHAGLCRIGTILNRSLQSAHEAAAFVGAGKPVASAAEIEESDFYLLGVPDDSIGSCAFDLSAAIAVRKDAVAFHCSGFIASRALVPLAVHGCSIVSVHPVKSFADPSRAIQSFEGTPCAMEGDARGIELLTPLFSLLGAKPFVLESSQKALYHAAVVMLSNYLAGLVGEAMRLLSGSGIHQEISREIVGALSRGTLDNIVEMGPVAALTGPLERGDVGTVTQEIRALEAFDPFSATLYKTLGVATVHLAEMKRSLTRLQIEELRTILGQPGP